MKKNVSPFAFPTCSLIPLICWWWNWGSRAWVGQQYRALLANEWDENTYFQSPVLPVTQAPGNDPLKQTAEGEWLSQRLHPVISRCYWFELRGDWFVTLCPPNDEVEVVSHKFRTFSMVDAYGFRLHECKVQSWNISGATPELDYKASLWLCRHWFLGGGLGWLYLAS